MVEAPPEVDITSGTADYLVIAHGDFLDGLSPLVRQREGQGLAVRVVDVADIYAQMNHGIVDAAAIRDYIRRAVAEQGVRYVLLVGGDTYDYANVGGAGSISFVPTLYAPTIDLVAWSPADPLFGDLDGDGVPDVPVGRLPVRTGAELDLVIDKILRYESRNDFASALFAADQGEPGEVPFTQDSERMITQLGDGWDVERSYVDILGFASARQRVLDELDAGRSVVSFVGHSGPTFWSFGGLVTTGDVDALQNVDAPSVVIQWGCWNTFYVATRYTTLGHRFLLAGEQGAAAVLGASVLLDTASARALSWPLMAALSDGPTTIGDAVVRAKQQMAVDRTGGPDVQAGWTLLGDPAMRVAP